MDREILYDLLGTTEIPGSHEQIKALATRLAELVDLNGRQWVVANRHQLLHQWQVALGLERQKAGESGGGKAMEDKKRLHVLIKGRVQGVCYRLETQKAARRFGVTGWVRNLPDGSVEGLFEGDAGAVEQLVAWCRQGPSLALVTDLQIDPRQYKGEFSGFEIRF